jgi:UDP-N-acetylglucosamine--N-acetylmuramyl-(pentapeptide) pyrophosphoryl-undecaprenol N-acetylglucosamine transferase
LVPSPNVAEDHQTKNAMALVNSNAAVLVRDKEAIENMIPRAMELLQDQNACVELSANILQLGKPNATVSIVNEIEKYARS